MITPLMMNKVDDCSTIFSIYPSTIMENKPGIYPGDFVIPPCLDDSKPERLLVKSSMHLMTLGGKKEPVRIETASFTIANSIVVDFLDGQMHAAPGRCPGICWIQGNISVDDFVNKHKEIYNRIKEDQRQWFIERVRQTDNEWAKHKHHRVVTDIDRFAARALGLEPEWMSVEEIGLNSIKCIACGTMNDPHNIICANCKNIFDTKKYKELTFA